MIAIDKRKARAIFLTERNRAPAPAVNSTNTTMIARHQHEHEAINAREYPGTRQLCATCDEPTERCEEDGIYTEDGEGPLCVDCWHKTPEWILENAKLSHEEGGKEQL